MSLTVEEMYQKVVAVALECDPKPASERGQDTLEPPWLVFRRIKRELVEARAMFKMTYKDEDRLREAGKEVVRLNEAAADGPLPRGEWDKAFEALAKALAGGEGE